MPHVLGTFGHGFSFNGYDEATNERRITQYPIQGYWVISHSSIKQRWFRFAVRFADIRTGGRPRTCGLCRRAFRRRFAAGCFEPLQAALMRASSLPCACPSIPGGSGFRSRAWSASSSRSGRGRYGTQNRYGMFPHRGIPSVSFPSCHLGHSSPVHFSYSMTSQLIWTPLTWCS